MPASAERNRFAVASYQGTAGASVDYQVSLFQPLDRPRLPVRPRSATSPTTAWLPASDRRNVASGVQLDSSYRLSDSHTVRAGLFLQHESFTVGNASTVFAADDDGNQTSAVPISIRDDSRITGNLYASSTCRTSGGRCRR